MSALTDHDDTHDDTHDDIHDERRVTSIAVSEHDGVASGNGVSPGAQDAPARRRRRSARTQRLFRWLHVYTSMISLLIVLFFGATGITLNHPDWTFGLKAKHTTATGTLPAGYERNGTADLLVVTEFVRSTYGISAPVSEHQADASQGSVSFAGPGYAASVTFDVPTGAYTVTVDQQGLVGVLNDLHKGRNSGSSWKWVIDVAGGLLVVVALTGLGIQLFMRKNRRLALGIALGGVALTVVLIAVTTV